MEQGAPEQSKMPWTRRPQVYIDLGTETGDVATCTFNRARATFTQLRDEQPSHRDRNFETGKRRRQYSSTRTVDSRWQNDMQLSCVGLNANLKSQMLVHIRSTSCRVHLRGGHTQLNK